MSTHTQYNYNRRNSSTTPYSIPSKHHHVSSHNGSISSSVPSLSRDFVARRISEGETGRLKEELKCEACGKGYKHISSLAKHLWEHTPEWNVTKKLLISKHQQVQLLEAASILVGMNESNPGSRRNLTFSSEYSNTGAGATDLSLSPSTTPPGDGTTSTVNETNNGYHPFKKSFVTENNGNFTNSIPQKSHRAHSISRYPPSQEMTTTSSKNEPGVPSLVGGYLDVREKHGEEEHEEEEEGPGSSTNPRTRVNSIAVPSETPSNLKSPKTSYSYSLAPPHPAVFSPSPTLKLDDSQRVNDSLDDELVIGKME